MRPSMNEIEVESKKAARGGGFSWGMAEEIGHAVAWLARSGIDSVLALLAVLDARSEGSAMTSDVASALAGRQTDDIPLCPLSLGVALADRADRLAAGQRIACGKVFRPILILPFIAAAAEAIGRPVILDCGFGEWHISPGNIDRERLAMLLHVDVVSGFACRAGQPISPPANPLSVFSRLEIEPDVWRRLQNYAGRTYVPASAQSRAMGAGAGAIDND